MKKYAITVLKTNGLENHKDTIYDTSKKEWCTKNSVEYIEITNIDPTFLGANNGVFLNQKYQCIDICEIKGFDKVINLDYDVIINPNTPLKIFDIIDNGIGITHDGFDSAFYKKQNCKIFGNLNIQENINYEFKCHKMQGGFFLYCKGTSKNLQFRNAKENIKTNLTNWGMIDEQAYITYLIHEHSDIKFKSLSRRYNYLPIFYDTCKHLWNSVQKNRYERYKKQKMISTRYDAYFIHYCGFNKRLKLAEIDFNNMKNKKINPPLFDELEEFIK
jgi:hypothetical protein